jgi:hypothetical protein
VHRVYSPLARLAETIESSNPTTETITVPKPASLPQPGDHQRVQNRLEDLANSSIRFHPPPHFHHGSPWGGYPYYPLMPYHTLPRPPPDLDLSHQVTGPDEKNSDVFEGSMHYPPFYHTPYGPEKRYYPGSDDKKPDLPQERYDRPPSIDLPRPPPIPPFYHQMPPHGPYHPHYSYDPYSRYYYDPYHAYARGIPPEETRDKVEQEYRKDDNHSNDDERPQEGEKDLYRYDMGRYYYPPPPHYYPPYPYRPPYYPPPPPRPPPE